jgi:hypothetical protein
MTKRDLLKKIAKENLGKTLKVDWLKDNYPELFFTPDCNTTTQELDEKCIEGLLWDYSVYFKKVDANDGTKKKNIISIKISEQKKKSKRKMFIELANPDDDGKSKIITREEFEKIEELKLGNGGSWCRYNSKLADTFIIKIYRYGDADNSMISAIELCGWNRDIQVTQRINKKIVDELKDKPCVFCGCTSNIEIDHKDGRKNDLSLNDIENQSEEQFQTTCKHCNDIKRQWCKECKKTNKRWSATNIKGLTIGFYKGDENYEGSCVGCYLYDPYEYRKYCESLIYAKD